MTLSLCRGGKSHVRPIRAVQGSMLASLILLSSFAAGCGKASKGTDANSAAGSNQKFAGNTNANAGSLAAGTPPGTIEIKEPERYSVTMTISAQESASEAPAPMLTQQLSFARLDADRRWAFLFPAPLGQVVYLEKSGLRYLVLFDRKQYVELARDALGFQLGNVLTPNAIVERLRTRQHEKLGLEPVNGRTAIKYRLAAATESSTHPDLIFVDQETGLPLRSELNSAAPGKRSRMIVEVRDVQLNPDRAQFDVPAGMKKVTQQEAKPQIESFASALRSFADIISWTH